jgi:hypothetical protein
MSAATVAFVCALVHRHPVLLPVLSEHLSDMSGEVLPHLLIADVERWAEAEAIAGRSQVGSDLASVLSMVEAEFVRSYDSDVGEMIAVSFLEHLPRPGEPGSELRRLVGARCAAELDGIG